MNDSPSPTPPPLVMKPARSKWQGCFAGCLVAAGIGMAIMVLLVIGVFFAVRGTFRQFTERVEYGYGGDEVPDLNEVWSAGDGDEKVARIHIDEMILLNSGKWSGASDLALAGIRRATHDLDVRGLIIELDSPGGGITASDILHNAVLDFKKADSSRRVVVLMNDLAASGAYYIACAADEIIAHPTTLTGSIGVIMQSYNINQLAGMIGITDVTVKSGANKDLLNPFRPVDQAQVDTLVQPIVDSMHRRFVDIVAAGRALPRETVVPLADGRLFDAQTALENKLIDVIGYRKDSEARMAALLDKPIFIVRYEEHFHFASLFRSSFMRLQNDASLGDALKGALQTPDTKFMYLWRP